MNTKLQLEQISEICQQLIDFIVNLIEKEASNFLTLQKEEGEITSDLTVPLEFIPHLN